MFLAALAVVLQNAVIEVPASRWKAVELAIPAHGTIVQCEFRVQKGSKVQLAIAGREQAERLHRGRSFRALYTTGFQNEARFRYRVADAGNYVLLVDNRIEGRSSATVDVSLQLLNPGPAAARELPPEIRHTVVAVSLLFFGSVLVFSAHQYLRQS
ncbi:MAG: hypothetical protein H7039_03490 [Bryobacteraceae bacterium]|nr:hypothetical protein [Bryobacteraceae bacterium]